MKYESAVKGIYSDIGGCVLSIILQILALCVSCAGIKEGKAQFSS